MPNIMIREYTKNDREIVRQISLATAMMGRPANLFFDGDEVLADALTMYFTDYEPESSFVAEVDGEVVGYVISAKDTRRMEKIFSAKIFWPLFGKAVSRGVFLRGKNWQFFSRALEVALKGGYFLPNFYAEYPATLHINVMEKYRGQGLGDQLVQKCLQYLGQATVKGVYVATMSDRAGAFFQKYGFRLFYASTRSYFFDVLNKDVPFKIFCRKFE